MVKTFPKEFMYTFTKIAGFLSGLGYAQWGKNITRLVECYHILLEENDTLHKDALRIVSEKDKWRLEAGRLQKAFSEQLKVRDDSISHLKFRNEQLKFLLDENESRSYSRCQESEITKKLIEELKTRIENLVADNKMLLTLSAAQQDVAVVQVASIATFNDDGKEISRIKFNSVGLRRSETLDINYSLSLD